MREFEALLGLFVAAVILAAAARRVGAPYPVFLALGGALLALLPASSFTLPPELALFVAPVLLDAAYDASLRDLIVLTAFAVVLGTPISLAARMAWTTCRAASATTLFIESKRNWTGSRWRVEGAVGSQGTAALACRKRDGVSA